MPRRRTPSDAAASRLAVLLTVVTVVAVLYAAQTVLEPLALAILLTFLLTPVAVRLERWGLGRVLSVLVTGLLATAVAGSLTWVMWSQASELAENLPSYRQNLRDRMETLVSGAGGPLTRAAEEIGSLSEEMAEAAAGKSSEGAQPTEAGASPAQPTSGAPALGGADASQAPVPVTVVSDSGRTMDRLRSLVLPLLEPLGRTAIVVVFTLFMLVHREDLRDRIIRLIGPSQLHATTQALDEAASRVSRYLLAMLVINLGFGAVATVGMLLIGVPNALLWGVLTVLLRFVPFIGPIIAAAMPIFVTLAVSDGWTRPLMVIGLFAALEGLSEYVFEPWLYGARTGLSTLAILVSALFWTWLWGVPGLILATPLGVCLVVLGRFVPPLRFLAVLLGDEPALPPEVRLYHRLLAVDQDAAFALMSEELEEHSLVEVYDRMLLPALALAERDRHRGLLDEERVDAIFATVRELVEELGERAAEAAAEAAAAEEAKARKEAAAVGAAEDSAQGTVADDDASAQRVGDSAPRKPVLCVAARDEADELVAEMLVQLLSAQGVAAEVVPLGLLASEEADTVAAREPAALCISAMPPMATAHARLRRRRLAERLPDVRIVIGLWTAGDSPQARERLRPRAVETIVGTLAEAVHRLRGAA